MSANSLDENDYGSDVELEEEDDEDQEQVINIDERYMFETRNAPSKPTALSLEEVRKRQDNEIMSISQLLDTTPDRAAVLLQRFDWRSEILKDQWFEDPEGVQRKFGLSLRPSEVKANKAPPGFSCAICWDAEEDPTVVCLSGCGHTFHTCCLRSYLRNSLGLKSSNALLTTCPQAGCTTICDRTVFSHFFADDKAMLDKYSYFRLSSYVEGHPKYRWCPNCQLPVHHPEFVKGAKGGQAADKSHVVQCTGCGEEFCFSCGLEAHAPATCKQLRLWLQKEQDESETANWVSANTKPCPQCGSTIEKNGGCNHMVCQQCKHEWCWICEADWAKHGNSWYKCNFYNEKADNTRNQRDKAKRELERYIFYYTRYRTHDQSKKFEGAMMKRVKDRMNQMQTAGGQTRLHEVEYLEESAMQLIQCRHALKYTYVYAFYLDSSGKDLFEHNQDHLERQTENLSGMLENAQKFDRQTIVTCAQVAKTMLVALRGGKYMEGE